LLATAARDARRGDSIGPAIYSRSGVARSAGNYQIVIPAKAGTQLLPSIAARAAAEAGSGPSPG